MNSGAFGGYRLNSAQLNGVESEVVTLVHTGDSQLLSHAIVVSSTGSLLRSTVVLTGSYNGSWGSSTYAGLAWASGPVILGTYSGDSDLMGYRSGAHQTSSALWKQITQGHTTSALLRLTSARTSPADSFLIIRATVASAGDSLKRATEAVTHLTGSLLRGTLVTATSTDALRRVTASTVHLTGSLLRGTRTDASSTDVMRGITGTPAHSGSSFLRRTRTPVSSTDVMRGAAGAAAHLVGSFLRGTRTAGSSTDLVRYLSPPRAHVADSLVSAAPVGSRTYNTASYIITRPRTWDGFTWNSGTWLGPLAPSPRAYTSSSFLKSSHTSPFTSSSALLRPSTRPSTVDADRRGQSTRTHSTSAASFVPRVIGQTSSSYLHLVRTGGYRTDVLKEAVPHLHNTNSLLVRVSAHPHRTDLVNAGSMLRAHTTTVRKQGTGTRPHSSGSLLRLVRTGSHPTDVSKIAAVVRHHTTSVRKQGSQTRAHSTGSMLDRVVVQPHSTGAALRSLRTLPVRADSAIWFYGCNHVTGSFLSTPFRRHRSDARIVSPVERVHRTGAVLRKHLPPQTVQWIRLVTIKNVSRQLIPIPYAAGTAAVRGSTLKVELSGVFQLQPSRTLRLESNRVDLDVLRRFRSLGLLAVSGAR